MRYLMMLVVLVVAGCGILDVSAARFVNQRPYDPGDRWYPDLYARVEACLGMTGDYSAIRWYTADAILVDGRSVVGIIEPRPNDITIRSDNVSGFGTVRHEMAHHITGRGNEAHDENGDLPCERDP